MRLAAVVLAATAVLLPAAGPAPAQAPAAGQGTPVDLDLLLLADATSSIDPVELALQRRGYAAALVDPAVLAAIAAGPRHRRIAVAYVEFGGRRRQDVVADWTAIAGAEDAVAFAARLLVAPRRARGVNAIGDAVLRGVALIEGNRFDGARKVIDVSGDSAWNPRPPTLADARAAATAAGVVVNALAILCENCSGRQGAGNLEAEYRDQVIAGPGAFVVTADGPAAFADAVRRKLLLEILAGAQSDANARQTRR